MSPKNRPAAIRYVLWAVVLAFCGGGWFLVATLGISPTGEVVATPVLAVVAVALHEFLSYVFEGRHGGGTVVGTGNLSTAGRWQHVNVGGVVLASVMLVLGLILANVVSTGIGGVVALVSLVYLIYLMYGGIFR